MEKGGLPSSSKSIIKGYRNCLHAISTSKIKK